jgi:hypothetical protein
VKDREAKVSRTHVKRLTSKKPDVRATQNPVQGLFSDSRRVLKNVLTYDPPARTQNQEKGKLRINVGTREQVAGRRCTGVPVGVRSTWAVNGT